jgi:predicted metal-dependent enzyme (double-stranded beta helix superfamily)
MHGLERRRQVSEHDAAVKGIDPRHDADATVALMTTALDVLIAATETALADPALVDDRGRAEAIGSALRVLLRDPDPIPSEARLSLEGTAVGNLLHADPQGRFHVLAVVFPEGTSSGVHHHGCWGVIGYLQGSDEETRYRCLDDTGDHAELEESSRHHWAQGDIAFLLPPDDGWHRVRSAGPGDGVSVHVLCRTPIDHPHRFWDRNSGAVHPYPFVEVEPGRWRSEVAWDEHGQLPEALGAGGAQTASLS